MTENQTPNDSFETEFHNLGKNFVNALRSAWDHPERKRLEDEIVSGLNELGSTIKNEADAFAESPTGQRFKSDMQDFSSRVNDPETYGRVRTELLGILKKANSELEKVIGKMTPQEDDQAAPADDANPETDNEKADI